MAGLEERLSKLESILHRLFCCDNSQFTGPQGPEGPQGEQGPPGPAGEIIYENINWVGEFVSCVVYNQFDVVSYNGSSYFLNCDGDYDECVLPPDDPCWVLLASVGATGPQGPQGIAGNDGANSGRWRFKGLQSSYLLGYPPDGGFLADTVNFSTLSSITIHRSSVVSADYYDWLNILTTLNYTIVPAYLQLTKVGNNAVIAVYEVTGSDTLIGPSGDESLKIYLNQIGGQAVNMTVDNVFTISWVLNGLGTLANKTYGAVTPTNLGVGAELIYDFNVVTTAVKTHCVYLPNTTQVGKEIVVFSRTEVGGNAGFYIQSNSEITLNISVPESTGYITNYGINNGLSYVVANPNSTYKFTFLGNFAAGGKAYWNMEALLNTYPTSGSQTNLDLASVVLDNPVVNTSVSTLSAANLTTLYGGFPNGMQILAPNQPGGGKLFIKTATGWLSSPLNTVP